MTSIRIEPVDDLDCRVIAYDWPFARERAADIAANWDRQIAAGRKLWNGRVLLSRDAHVETRGGRRVFTADHFETDFAAFLAFRDFGFPDPRVKNCFAMAALRAADGPFLLARMGVHTANPGRIYFAAGTPDPGDIRGRTLDLAGSVLRELAEETGLTEVDVTQSPGYTLVRDEGRIACMREVRTRDDCDAVVARVARFVAAENDPEIDGLVPVRDARDLQPDHMPDFIQAYLRAQF